MYWILFIILFALAWKIDDLEIDQFVSEDEEDLGIVF